MSYFAFQGMMTSFSFLIGYVGVIL